MDVIAQLERFRGASPRFAQTTRPAALLDSEEGRAILHAAISTAVWREIDYQGLARRFLRVHALHPGELFRIAKPQETPAFVSGSQGVEARVYGRYVTPEYVSVDTQPILPWDADEGALRRAVRVAVSELCLCEDRLFQNLVHTASRTVHPILMYERATFDVIVDLRDTVEARARVPVERLWINREDPAFFRKVGDVWKLDPEPSIARMLDPCVKEDLRAAGFVGSIMGMQVIHAPKDIEDVVPNGTIYALPVPEQLGVFVARQCLSWPQLDAKGGVVFPIIENFAMGISNVRHVARAERKLPC